MKPTRLRMAILLAVLTALFAAMIFKLGNMQLVHQDDYIALAEQRSTKTYQLYGKRGTIYDTNMIPLAYDRGSYNVTFYRDPTQTSDEARAQYTQAIIRAIEIIEGSGKTLTTEFWLERGEDGQWRFNTGAATEAADKSRIKQWRGNFYLSSETRYPSRSCSTRCAKTTSCPPRFPRSRRSRCSPSGRSSA